MGSLAALLHDADDRKVCASQDFEHARRIVREVEVGCGLNLSDLVIEMISYVSFTSNGNDVNDRSRELPYLLWPRFCDRLEAMGDVGIRRCADWNCLIGAPESVVDTPRPMGVEEALAEATEERALAYRTVRASRSLIDHYFDKLRSIEVGLLLVLIFAVVLFAFRSR